MKATQETQVRVGLLILLSLAVLGGTIFMLGKERRLFENRVVFKIEIYRTNGRTVWAPVIKTGVTGGSVEIQPARKPQPLTRGGKKTEGSDQS